MINRSFALKIYKKGDEMRKVSIQLTVAVAAILLMVSACGGKYDDAISTNDKFVDAVENYCQDMDKADNADQVADALNDFAASIENLAPKMKAIAEKYPELKDPDQIPEELKESQARAEEVSMKMAGQMMKAMKHMRDDGVREAQMRIQKAMASMGK